MPVLKIDETFVCYRSKLSDAEVLWKNGLNRKFKDISLFPQSFQGKKEEEMFQAIKNVRKESNYEIIIIQFEFILGKYKTISNDKPRQSEKIFNNESE